MAQRFMVKVFFLILVSAKIISAQSAPPRKDIPSIAKAANGSIVSIVMSDKEGKPLGQGSGFVVSTDGSIITNYHVIAEGVSAVAKFPDGAFYLIDGVVASDKSRDVAILKAHGHNFRPLSLGNSDRVQVGEEVVAIGSPLSLESTVSNGIVSGMRTAEDLGGKFLQVTAPISPGSSGGPLFNMMGEVIGITTMYIKGGENLNFAIPINDAKRLLPSKSSTLREWPDEHESTNTEKRDHEEHAPYYAESVGDDSAAFHFYWEDHEAGVFTPEQFGTAPDGSKVSLGRMLSADFVCFSSDAHSDEFFTFQTWAYDKEYDDAQQQMIKNQSREELIKQQTIMNAIQAGAPYVSFGTGTIAGYMPSGGRLLKKDIYAKGVNIDTLEYHWDGTSWFHYPYLGYLVTLGTIPRRNENTPASKPRAHYLSLQLVSKPDDLWTFQVLRYVESDADHHVVASGFCKRETCSPRFPKCM